MSSDPNAAGMNPVRVTRTTTSTAVTNLSNGTPVFFRASAISKYSKYNPYLAESVSAQAVSATPQAP